MKAVKYLGLLLSIMLFAGCSEDGKDGRDGNANVRSTTVSVKSYQWFGQQGSYSVTVSAPAITQDVMNFGDVRVYIKSVSSDAYQALPVTYKDYSTIRYWFSVGKIQLEYLYNNPSLSVTSDLVFKMVVIDGNPDLVKIDLNDYDAVSDYYHLED